MRCGSFLVTLASLLVIYLGATLIEVDGGVKQRWPVK